jgi:thiol-disulfide isomerase/thioredoxin
VIVLNLWGSWCSVCQQEAPALSAAARQFTPAGVRFVGVDVADDPASAKAYMQDHRLLYPSLSGQPLNETPPEASCFRAVAAA